MNLLSKSAGVGASAALLASLVAAVAAPLAFASTSVTSAGDIPVGGTSTGTATFVFIENSSAAFTGPGSLTVTVIDQAGGNTLTLSGGTLSAPGSLVPILSVSGNTFSVTTNNSDPFNVEPITVSGIAISASSTAAMGAVQATLSGSLAGAVTQGGQFTLTSPGMVVRKVASAAGPKTCLVKNTTLKTSYNGTTGSVLQDAIDAAGFGNTLEVRGICIGNFRLTTKTLTLVGKAKDGYPVATLDGNGSGHVVLLDFCPPGTTCTTDITLTDLLITNGDAPDINDFGGGIYNNHAILTLNGSTQVSGNRAAYGGGIASFGTVTLKDSARVVGNTASVAGGGIYILGAPLNACATWTGSINANTPDDPPTPTPITC